MSDCFSTDNVSQETYEKIRGSLVGMVDFLKRVDYPQFSTCVIDVNVTRRAKDLHSVEIIPSSKRDPDGPDVVFHFDTIYLRLADDSVLDWACNTAFRSIEPVLRPDGSQVYDDNGRPRLRYKPPDTAAIPKNETRLIGGRLVRVPIDYPQP